MPVGSQLVTRVTWKPVDVRLGATSTELYEDPVFLVIPVRGMFNYNEASSEYKTLGVDRVSGGTVKDGNFEIGTMYWDSYNLLYMLMLPVTARSSCDRQKLSRLCICS